MSSIRKIFSTDPSVETQGVWQDYGNGVEILIARAGGSNKAFARRFTELTKPHRRLIQAEAVDDKTAQEILYQVYAETVVKDWKGITAEDLDPESTTPNEPVACTAKNAVILFKALPDLFSDIVAQAGKLAMYRQVVNEGDAKN
jgi:hypothetical protein